MGGNFVQDFYNSVRNHGDARPRPRLVQMASKKQPLEKDQP